MNINKVLITLAGLLACAHVAVAADIYTVTASIGGQTVNLGFSTSLTTLDSLQTENLSASLPSYTGVEVATFVVNYRGLPLNMAYPTANSTLLTFDIPSLGISQTFTGATRNESKRLLVDYLKKGDFLGLMQKKLAEVSPVDPTAGNPNSLMSQMIANDFATGFLNGASNIAPQTAGAESTNLIGVGLRFGQYRQDGLSSQSITLPFSYTIRSDIDPRRQLIISLPVSQTTVEGAKAYYVGGGLTYRFPMNDQWTLTPSVSYALTGSVDLGSFSQIAAGSLTSTYVFNQPGFDIAVGNMIGYYKTLKFSHSGYSYDPGIANTVFRNGVMFSTPTNAFGKTMSIEYSLIDTRFTGSALYTRSYDEIGVTLGTNKHAQSARSYFRGGMNYLFSPKSKGFSINLGYWF